MKDDPNGAADDDSASFFDRRERFENRTVHSVIEDRRESMGRGASIDGWIFLNRAATEFELRDNFEDTQESILFNAREVSKYVKRWNADAERRCFGRASVYGVVSWDQRRHRIVLQPVTGFSLIFDTQEVQVKPFRQYDDDWQSQSDPNSIWEVFASKQLTRECRVFGRLASSPVRSLTVFPEEEADCGQLISSLCVEESLGKQVTVQGWLHIVELFVSYCVCDLRSCSRDQRRLLLNTSDIPKGIIRGFRGGVGEGTEITEVIVSGTLQRSEDPNFVAVLDPVDWMRQIYRGPTELSELFR